jgi:hypothetical protein
MCSLSNSFWLFKILQTRILDLAKTNLQQSYDWGRRKGNSVVGRCSVVGGQTIAGGTNMHLILFGGSRIRGGTNLR